LPTSNPYAIVHFIEKLMEMKPQSILDVGPGFGKYGFLAREYLEVWFWRIKKSEWKIQIDCLEAYEPYISVVHKYIYNNIYIGDVRKFPLRTLPNYDVIIFSDVIEHMEKDVGKKVLARLYDKANKAVLVSTPAEWYGARRGCKPDDFESHVCYWAPEEILAIYKNTEIIHSGSERGMKTYLAVIKKDS